MRELYCGDCLSVLSKYPSQSVDLVLTDPPYDLPKEEQITYHREMERITKTGIILFSPPENQWFGPPEQYGFWCKTPSTKNTSKRYSRFVEMVFFYGKLKWNTQYHWSQYTNVFHDLVVGSTGHPYEKPLSLLERLIRNHSDEGDIICDPFCGSGSTLVAAFNTKRNYLGIEENEDHYSLSRDRLSSINAL